jgi:hypothetical protein
MDTTVLSFGWLLSVLIVASSISMGILIEDLETDLLKILCFQTV